MLQKRLQQLIVAKVVAKVFSTTFATAFASIRSCCKNNLLLRKLLRKSSQKQETRHDDTRDNGDQEIRHLPHSEQKNYFLQKLCQEPDSQYPKSVFNLWLFSILWILYHLLKVFCPCLELQKILVCNLERVDSSAHRKLSVPSHLARWHCTLLLSKLAFMSPQDWGSWHQQPKCANIFCFTRVVLSLGEQIWTHAPF